MADALARVSDMLVRVRHVSQRMVDETRAMFGSLGALLCRVDGQGTGLHAVAVSGDIGQAYGSHLTFAAGLGTAGLALLPRTLRNPKGQNPSPSKSISMESPSAFFR